MSIPDWAPFRSIIEQNNSFLITSHVRPDADALGSELGIAAILKSFGRQVTIVNASAPPSNLHFLNRDGSILKLNEDIQADSLPETDVFIIADTSAWQQLGSMADVIRSADKQQVVIDHHVSSDSMNALELKNTEAAATGELVCQAAEYLGVSFDAETASALYAAIATDTGWFRFPSTSETTMRIAADLMQRGARPDVLFNLLYEQKSPARVRLAGRVLNRLELDADGRLAWIYADKKDLMETKAVPSDTESLVNECLMIAGVQAAFIAVQQPGGQIKFSLRCRQPYDVARLAESFGGGGHKLASGATVPGPLEEAVKAVREQFIRMLEPQPTEDREPRPGGGVADVRT